MFDSEETKTSPVTVRSWPLVVAPTTRGTGSYLRLPSPSRPGKGQSGIRRAKTRLGVAGVAPGYALSYDWRAHLLVKSAVTVSSARQ